MCLCFLQFFFLVIDIYSHSIVIREDAWYDFSFLKLTELWPNTWSVLENFLWALEKKVYSSAFRWNVLKISVRSILSNVSFKTCVSFIIFHFDDLFTGVKNLLLLLSVSPLCILVLVLCIEVLLCWMHRYLQCYVFLLDWSLDHHVVSFLMSCNLLYFKVYFVWYEDCYSSFLLLPICMEYIFHPLTFSLYVSLGPK